MEEVLDLDPARFVDHRGKDPFGDCSRPTAGRHRRRRQLDGRFPRLRPRRRRRPLRARRGRARGRPQGRKRALRLGARLRGALPPQPLVQRGVRAQALRLGLLGPPLALRVVLGRCKLVPRERGRRNPRRALRAEVHPERPLPVRIGDFGEADILRRPEHVERAEARQHQDALEDDARLLAVCKPVHRLPRRLEIRVDRHRLRQVIDVQVDRLAERREAQEHAVGAVPHEDGLFRDVREEDLRLVVAPGQQRVVLRLRIAQREAVVDPKDVDLRAQLWRQERLRELDTVVVDRDHLHRLGHRAVLLGGGDRVVEGVDKGVEHDVRLGAGQRQRPVHEPRRGDLVQVVDAHALKERIIGRLLEELDDRLVRARRDKMRRIEVGGGAQAKLRRGRERLAVARRDGAQLRQARAHGRREALLKPAVGRHQHVLGRRLLPGPVHAANLLHGLLRRPRQLEEDHAAARSADAVGVHADPGGHGAGEHRHLLPPHLEILEVALRGLVARQRDPAAALRVLFEDVGAPGQLGDGVGAAEAVVQRVERRHRRQGEAHRPAPEHVELKAHAAPEVVVRRQRRQLAELAQAKLNLLPARRERLADARVAREVRQDADVDKGLVHDLCHLRDGALEAIQHAPVQHRAQQDVLAHPRVRVGIPRLDQVPDVLLVVAGRPLLLRVLVVMLLRLLQQPQQRVPDAGVGDAGGLVVVVVAAAAVALPRLFDGARRCRLAGPHHRDDDLHALAEPVARHLERLLHLAVEDQALEEAKRLRIEEAAPLHPTEEAGGQDGVEDLGRRVVLRAPGVRHFDGLLRELDAVEAQRPRHHAPRAHRLGAQKLERARVLVAAELGEEAVERGKGARRAARADKADKGRVEAQVLDARRRRRAHKRHARLVAHGLEELERGCRRLCRALAVAILHVVRLVDDQRHGAGIRRLANEALDKLGVGLAPALGLVRKRIIRDEEDAIRSPRDATARAQVDDLGRQPEIAHVAHQRLDDLGGREIDDAAAHDLGRVEQQPIVRRPDAGAALADAGAVAHEERLVLQVGSAREDHGVQLHRAEHAAAKLGREERLQLRVGDGVRLRQLGGLRVAHGRRMGQARRKRFVRLIHERRRQCASKAARFGNVRVRRLRAGKKRARTRDAISAMYLNLPNLSSGAQS